MSERTFCVKSKEGILFWNGSVMDRVDHALLAALEGDGRQSFATLAETANLSKTSCWTRVQALERNGAIRGYGADIDPSAIGLQLTGYVQVMIDPAKRSEFETAIMAVPAILACTTVAGDADYVLTVVAPDVGQLDQFLRDTLSLLPGLQRSSTTICLKSIKGNGSLVAAAESYQPGRRRR